MTGSVQSIKKITLLSTIIHLIRFSLGETSFYTGSCIALSLVTPISLHYNQKKIVSYTPPNKK